MTAPGDDVEAARALALAHGWNANAYQILNPGFLHWFAADRDAVVGYVAFGGFRVVAGAPVCAEARLGAVLEEFERDTAAAGLRVCYFGAETRLASQLGGRSDRSMLRLGAQPAWDPAHWEDGVKPHASLRAQLARARNKGVIVSEQAVTGEAQMSALRRCLDEWLSTRGAPPMHFLVEPQTLERLHDRRLFVAEKNGAVIGFLVASPVPRRDGWLIEQIIRGANAVNGTSELLVDAAMHALAADGARYVTLGLSPLSVRSGVGEVPTPLWLRLLLGWLRAHGRRFYNFEGLDAFKAKLGPQFWEPVYAIADRPGFSPVVLHAMAGAFTGGSPVLATLRALVWALGKEARNARRWSATRLKKAARPTA